MQVTALSVTWLAAQELYTRGLMPHIHFQLFHALGSVRSHFGNIPYCDLVMGSR